MKFIHNYLPAGFWIRLKRAVYFPKDLVRSLTGRNDQLTPPEGLNFIGGGNFESIGQEFLDYFQRYVGLQPDAKVLDIGCGIGRMAIPLIGFLKEPGRYYGVDIVRQGIDWCAENITSRHPNFHFELSDIYNKEYNPKGKYKAAEYRFPYMDNSFDFIFLTSVFTHMLKPDMQNYVNEIGRLLKPGGKCLATYYLLNEVSFKALEEGKTRLRFRHPVEGGLVVNLQNPEYAIAYNEGVVESIFAEGGLHLLRPFLYGNWSGRPDFLSHQDICLASK